MNEKQIQKRVHELIAPITEILGDERDPAIILAVISELFAIFLSLYPVDKRKDLLDSSLKLTKERLRGVPQLRP